MRFQPKVSSSLQEGAKPLIERVEVDEDGRDLRSDDSLLEPFSPRRFLSGCLADKLREMSRYKCTIVKIKPTSMLLSRDPG